MENFCCSTSEEAKSLLADQQSIERLAELYKAFSEPIRIEILLAMLHNEICVCDLALLLQVSQPRVSNQLKYLKQNRLIKSRKDKNNVYYSLDDEHIQEILTIGLKHIKH